MSSSASDQPRYPHLGHPGFVFTVPRPAGLMYADPHERQCTFTTSVSDSISTLSRESGRNLRFHEKSLQKSTGFVHRASRGAGRLDVERDLRNQVVFALERAFVAKASPELDP
jgi:hypothetical protein